MRVPLSHYRRTLAGKFMPAPSGATLRRYCRTGAIGRLPCVSSAMFEFGRWWVELDVGLSGEMALRGGASAGSED